MKPQIYMLYIALIGLWLSSELSSGVFGYIRVRDLQMRAKRSKAMDDIWSAGGGGDIVSSLAAGGGGSSNCRAISPVYTPRTANQKTYVKYLEEDSAKIVLGVGAAGSGKTLFACYTAIQELRRGSVSKIIMTRPVVPVEEEEIGFLPGSLINKMDPWTRPIFDILLEFYAQKDIDAMLHGGVIEISPLAFMRGRTFKRAFIIADEMQNSSPNQMLMLTTRLGEGSKMVITGDLKQSDRGTDNGLSDLLRKLKAYENRGETDSIKYVELESEDVQRSPIVSKILDIYGGAAPKPNTVVLCNTTTLVNVPLVEKKINASYITNHTVHNSTTKSNRANISDNDAALIPIHHMSKYLINKRI